jgi:hypothetical protein
MESDALFSQLRALVDEQTRLRMKEQLRPSSIA